MEIFHQHRATRSDGFGVLVVADGVAESGGEGLLIAHVRILGRIQLHEPDVIAYSSHSLCLWFGAASTSLLLRGSKHEKLHARSRAAAHRATDAFATDSET